MKIRCLIAFGLFLTLTACSSAGGDTTTISTQTSWPQCSSPSGNPATSNSMNDSKSSCVGCELVTPCSTTNEGAPTTIFNWYSPKICQLCSKDCAAGTKVNAFCTAYFGAQCSVYESKDGKPTKYGCSNGLVYMAETHAAYGIDPSNVAAYCGGMFTNPQTNETQSYPACSF